MEKITPYSDDKMLYNTQLDRYELSMSWVKANFNNPFTDDTMLESRIKKNTRKVYNFMFSHAYSGNRRVINAIINHTEEYRTYIYDALMAQMEADITSAYNDQDLFVPDNKDQRDMQFVNQVSAETQSILESGAGYGGINLLYASLFNNGVYLSFMEYLQ